MRKMNVADSRPRNAADDDVKKLRGREGGKVRKDVQSEMRKTLCGSDLKGIIIIKNKNRRFP